MPDTTLPAIPLLIASAADGDTVDHDALQAKRDRLDETEIELQTITDEGVDLYAAIDRLVRAFADKHGCEAFCTLDGIDREITGLVNDATGPAWRRKTRIEDEIEAARELAS